MDCTGLLDLAGAGHTLVLAADRHQTDRGGSSLGVGVAGCRVYYVVVYSLGLLDE